MSLLHCDGFTQKYPRIVDEFTLGDRKELLGQNLSMKNFKMQIPLAYSPGEMTMYKKFISMKGTQTLLAYSRTVGFSTGCAQQCTKIKYFQLENDFHQ